MENNARQMRHGLTVNELYVLGRPNSLNLIRLLLAASVILWHSYAVLDAPRPQSGLRELLGALPVNGFFAISGFLIFRSWARKPSARDYLVARVLRIYPAFWACLIATALLFAPIASWIQGEDPLAQAFSPESLTYVLKNSSLAMLQWRIGDSPTGVPFLESWNASLWTLAWEFLCYLGLLGLGLVGMTRRKWILPTAFASSALLNLAATQPFASFEVAQRVGRFSIFFLAGALVAQYADRIRMNWVTMLVSLTIAVSSSWIPLGHYLVQAPATAIGLVALGGMVNPRFAEFRNDISYGVYIYAFPVQQLLVVAGVVAVDVFSFAAIALALTIPLAIASWLIVEKPALRFRKRMGYPTWFRLRRPGPGPAAR